MSRCTSPRRVTSRLALFSAVATLASGSGCSRPASPNLPPKPFLFDVGIVDHRFEHGPASIPPGRVVINARNSGGVEHQVVLVRLPEDLPPLDVELSSSQSTPVETVRIVPTLAPGEPSSFAVDLPPGRYGMICFLTDADGQTYAQKGMSSEFRVA